jgi:putative PIN family toxin of toxin-antitoxin system
MKNVECKAGVSWRRDATSLDSPRKRHRRQKEACRADSTCAIIKKVSERLVLDTSVWVAALKSDGGASREVLRLCLQTRCRPLMGVKLFTEFESVMGRAELFRGCLLAAPEREALLDAFLSVCEWVPVFYLWRPNLPDEGDNHLIELALAGSAATVVTHNVRDLRGGELRFPQLGIETPVEFLKRWRKEYGNDDNSTS